MTTLAPAARGQRGRRRGLVIVTTLYLAGALVVGFWPTPVDRPVDRTLFRILFALHRAGGPSWVSYATVEFTANILFFVPIGLLLCLLCARRRWFIALLAGVLGSCTIELGQYLLRPDRVASLQDVAANSLGTALGVGFVLVVRARRAHRAHRARVSRAPRG